MFGIHAIFTVVAFGISSQVKVELVVDGYHLLGVRDSGRMG